MATVTGPELRQNNRFWRSVGPWLVLAAALYLLVAAVRAIVDPTAFASYAGLPLQHSGDDNWVYVYASRTVLLSGVALVLLHYRHLKALTAYAVLSVIGPLWDAALEIQAKAGAATVVRQFAIVTFLLVVAVVLARQQRRSAGEAPDPR